MTDAEFEYWNEVSVREAIEFQDSMDLLTLAGEPAEVREAVLARRAIRNAKITEQEEAFAASSAPLAPCELEILLKELEEEDLPI